MPLFGAGISSYMPIADGNVSDGTKWALIDPISIAETDATNHVGAYTALTNGTSGTTNYKTSSSFTYIGSGPTIDGIAIKIVSRTSAGTITICLGQGVTDVAGTTTTCNVNNLPLNGWVFIRFSAPVTLAALEYTVRFKVSVSGSVSLKIFSGGANFCRLLRTTTTGTAPIASSSQKDNLFIMGEITGASTFSSRVMIWDIVSNTYPFNLLSISYKATVISENNPATNYYIHVQNDVIIYDQGTLYIGSLVAPILGTFTFTLNYNLSQVCSIIIVSGGTLRAFGQPKVAFRTVLTANVAAGGTSINVSDATSWAIGDTLVIACTDSTTHDRTDRVTISSITGNTIGITATVYAHSGTGGKVAEVVNLTRNVIIKGFANTGKTGNIGCLGGTLELNSIETINLTDNYTAMGGFYIQTTGTGTTNIQYCAIHNAESAQVSNIYINTINADLVFSNNIVYAVGSAFLEVRVASGFTGTPIFYNNVFMRNGLTDSFSSGILWSIAGEDVVFANNSISSINSGFDDSSAIEILEIGNLGYFADNTIHSAAGIGVSVLAVQTQAETMTWVSLNWTIWLTDVAFVFAKDYSNCYIQIRGMVAFSNTVGHLKFMGSLLGEIYFTGLDLQGGTSPVSGHAIMFANGGFSNRSYFNLIFDNCNIGGTTALGEHCVCLWQKILIQASFRNCLFNAPSILNSQNLMSGRSFIGSDRHQQQDDFINWTLNGIVKKDDVIYALGAPSMRVIPLVGTGVNDKMIISNFYVNVSSGNSPTVSIKIRKSNTAAGDSATYNGNQPKFWVWFNAAAGFSDNYLLDTATSASDGNWEILEGMIPAVASNALVGLFIEVDGSAGWVNIDDFATSQTTSDSGNLSFSFAGAPFVVLGNGSNTIIPVPIIRKKVQ